MAAKSLPRLGERSGRSERRKHPRLPLTLEGTGSRVSIPVRRGGPFKELEARSMDVSLGGMKVNFSEPVKKGDTVRLKFLLPREGEVSCDTLVRWVRREPQAGYVAGLAFRNEVPQRVIRTLMKLGEAGMPRFAEASARQINLPLIRAVEISMRSLKIRFGRSLVTSAVVFLAIAFLVYMLSVESVTANLQVGQFGEEIGQDLQAIQDQRLWVALISLLVAAVGITNTLHMSVAERYREIGTMKCLGALDRFVVELFLLEALMMGAIGSASGALGGTVMAMMPWVFRIKEAADAVLPWGVLGKNLLIGLAVGMILTIVGSLYPALRAAQMAPAEAMRTEV